MVERGVRLRDVTAGELVAIAYHLIIESIQQAEDYLERRAELDKGLRPIRRPAPGAPVEPPADLPARLREIQPPSWWSDDD